jgi:ankyrin repeat protein
MTNSGHRLNATEVLRRYREEELPEFWGRPLDDVNEVGRFGSQPIHVAAVRGALDELTALLDGGADVSAVGEKGHTPLHHAVGQNHLEAVKLLLARGARTNLKNDWGKTAIDVAKTYKRDDLVALLEKALEPGTRGS